MESLVSGCGLSIIALFRALHLSISKGERVPYLQKISLFGIYNKISSKNLGNYAHLSILS